MSIAKKNTAKGTVKVTFKLDTSVAPEASDVRVLGDFNHWDWAQAPQMKAKNGQYTTVVELAAGNRYEFRYLIDHTHWTNDDGADAYVPSPFYGIDNCVVDVPAAVAAAKPKPKRRKKKIDLTIIEGVGPKIKGLLEKAGFDSFAAVAKAKVADLKAVLDEAGPRYRMHNPTTWPEQAALAAAEKWEELEALKDQLDGGKR
ncbi:MAG: isoamylase early set domain-containing protein [Bacteroidota bacterium]